MFFTHLICSTVVIWTFRYSAFVPNRLDVELITGVWNVLSVVFYTFVNGCIFVIVIRHIGHLCRIAKCGKLHRPFRLIFCTHSSFFVFQWYHSWLSTISCGSKTLEFLAKFNTTNICNSSESLQSKKTKLSIGNLIVYCSNYDRKFHKRVLWPHLSLDEIEEHSMAPTDLRVVVVGSPPPKHRKKWGKQHTLWLKKVRTGGVIMVSI